MSCPQSRPAWDAGSSKGPAPRCADSRLGWPGLGPHPSGDQASQVPYLFNSLAASEWRSRRVVRGVYYRGTGATAGGLQWRDGAWAACGDLRHGYTAGRFARMLLFRVQPNSTVSVVPWRSVTALPSAAAAAFGCADASRRKQRILTGYTLARCFSGIKAFRICTASPSRRG